MDGMIKNVDLTSGDEGYKVCCCYMKAPMGGGGYEPMRFETKEFFFSEKESKEAFAKFLELDKMKKGEE